MTRREEKEKTAEKGRRIERRTDVTKEEEEEDFPLPLDDELEDDDAAAAEEFVKDKLDIVCVV